MFGFVGNLTAIPKLREAEATDARFGLGVHEEIRKQHDEELPQDGQEEAAGDHAAEFSTLSLIKFFESFLEDRLGKIPDDHDRKNAVESRWLRKNSANQNITKRATQAYSHAAEIARGTFQKKPQEADLRSVYALLRDLRYLHGSGVSVLSVPQNQSFLHSVRDAVSLAITQI